MEVGELLRVELANWPFDRGAGGWLHPYDERGRLDRLAWWVVDKVHARYLAPRRIVRRWEPLLGQEVEQVAQMFDLRAYLIDISSEWGLEPMERVLLHQRPQPVPWWFLRRPNEEELAQMEQYRQV